MEYEPILPLRMVVFQILFFLVAIALEAGILRQRLRLGFQTSVQYAFVTNLATIVFGWITFLVLEPLMPLEVEAQIINYIMFNQLIPNGWTTATGAILFGIGLAAFFGTFFIKAKGIEFFLRSDDAWQPLTKRPKRLPRDERYARAREMGIEAGQSNARFIDTIIQANAASFSAILLLILLRALVKSQGG